MARACAVDVGTATAAVVAVLMTLTPPLVALGQEHQQQQQQSTAHPAAPPPPTFADFFPNTPRQEFFSSVYQRDWLISNNNNNNNNGDGQGDGSEGSLSPTLKAIVDPLGNVDAMCDDFFHTNPDASRSPFTVSLVHLYPPVAFFS